MKITTTLSAKTDKHTQKSEILLRLIVGKVNGKTVTIRAKSRIFVNPERWDAKEGTIQTDIRTTKIMSAQKRKEVEEEKQVLQETSDNLSALCSEIRSKFLTTPIEEVTKEWLDDVIDRYRFPDKYKEKEVKPAFFATFEAFLNKHKLSEVRKKNFRVIYRALQRFEAWSGTTLDLDTITQETLRDFEEFLRVESSYFEQDPHSKKWSCINEDYKAIYEAFPETRTPQPRGQNTINDIFTKIRTFYLWCIDNGKTTNNPFRHYKIEECVYGTPYYISIDERNMLYNTDLSARPQLAIQRDIFVLQCLIGCRVGDLYRFTKANVINGAIEYIPRKTKDGRSITVRVPLNAIAKEILDRYADYEGKSLLPYISEQKYNKAIKEAFKLAGITRIVTVRNPTTGEEEQRPINELASSHLARRCFVGNLYKQVKDPNLVGALSGHKQGSKAFTRYREIDEEMKQDLVKLLE
jgi:integrase